MIKDGKEVDEYCNEIEQKIDRMDLGFLIVWALAWLCVITFVIGICFILYETFTHFIMGYVQ